MKVVFDIYRVVLDPNDNPITTYHASKISAYHYLQDQLGSGCPRIKEITGGYRSDTVNVSLERVYRFSKSDAG